VVPRRSALILALGLIFYARLATAWQDPAEVSDPTAAEPIAIEERPYKIRAFVSFDSKTRIDARGRDRLVEEWLGLARRLVGPAWEIQVADSEGASSAFVLEDLVPAAVKPLGVGVDKVWLIQAKPSGGATILMGRELDVATGWLGSPHSRKVPLASDLAREIFKLSQEIFAPYAEIGEPQAENVPLRVQGCALPNGSAGDVISPPGSVFRPVRVLFRPDGSVSDVLKIPYSYLLVEKRDGRATDSLLIRGVKDPLTKRYPRKNRLIALGVKPGTFPTKFRFIRASDRQPASGFVLTYRTIPQGQARELATTDRNGRVQLPPGFSDGLVVVRLIAGHINVGPNSGRSEPLGEVPIMPGETAAEMTIPIDPRPQALALETQLDALRDSIVDLILVRKRLDARMKAREQGDDWKGVEEALVEYRKLPPRDAFLKRLDALAQDAAKQEARTKSIVLTKTARAQLADTRSLIERYLEDETFRAYEDAVARVQERDAKPKAKPKAKPAPRSVTPEPAVPSKAAPPPPAAPPAGQEKKKAPPPVVPF
jgi:hypothetical protein